MLGINWQTMLSRFTGSAIPRLAHAHTGREATRLSQENVALPCLALRGSLPHLVFSFVPDRWISTIYQHIQRAVGGRSQTYQ